MHEHRVRSGLGHERLIDLERAKDRRGAMLK
jgi:hypothetical protein